MGQNWTVPAGTYRYIAMDTYFEEQSQSTDKNNTVLYWAIRGWDTSGSDAYWFSYAVNVGSLVVNGTTVFNRTGGEEILISIGTDTSSTKKKIIAEGTITIPHDTDGGKDCVTSFSLHPRWNQANYDWQNSKTLSLTDIPRASSFTISDTTVNFGESVTFTITRAVSTFTHKLKYSIGSASGTIASNVATSASWTIPSDLMKQVTSATSGKITIICETYSGSELIGSKTATITASVPSSVIPSLTVTVAEAATIPSALSGMYIQGRSKLKVTSSGTGQYGATIKSYTVNVEYKEYSGASITTSTIIGYGTVPIKVSATDSRGRTAIETTYITVNKYNLPKLTGVAAYRCASNTDTTKDNKGSYICVKPKGEVTSLNNQNAKNCIVYYKKSSDTTYSSTSLTMGDYVLDNEYVIFFADINSSYDIYVLLMDSFGDSGSKYVTPQVSTVSSYIHIPSDRRGIGLGKRLEGDGMEVGWDANFSGNVYGNVYGLGYAPLIPSNSDLNTYLNTGMYSVRVNTTAETIANFPPDKVSGKLIVESGKGIDLSTIPNTGMKNISQIFIPNAPDYPIYKRLIIIWGSPIDNVDYGDWQTLYPKKEFTRTSAEYTVKTTEAELATLYTAAKKCIVHINVCQMYNAVKPAVTAVKQYNSAGVDYYQRAKSETSDTVNGVFALEVGDTLRLSASGASEGKNNFYYTIVSEEIK